MNLAVVGYRKFTNYEILRANLDDFVLRYGKPKLVISGGCVGTDLMAIRWAQENNIETEECLPNTHTREHFLARNTEIVRRCDILIAFLSPKSRGTWDSINKAKSQKKPIFIVNI